MRRALTALLSTAAIVPLLAGCGADRSSATDSPRASGGPTFPESTERQSGKGSGGSDLVLVDVRVAEGEGEGVDRIVLEFSGTGTPGWVVNYVDEAVLEGSGEVVDLEGTAVLDIYASGTTWPAPDYYAGPARLSPREDGAVDEVYVAGTFEGHTQVLAGIDGDRVPFRVSTLTAPARLVIDVADEDAE